MQRPDAKPVESCKTWYSLSVFRPGGAKELSPTVGVPPPLRGECVETRSPPRVAHRPLCSGRCFTRGYTPPPRWGEERQLQSLPAVAGPQWPFPRLRNLRRSTSLTALSLSKGNLRNLRTPHYRSGLAQCYFCLFRPFRTPNSALRPCSGRPEHGREAALRTGSAPFL